MNVAVNEKEVESFDPWYVNYSAGIPEFANSIKTRLLGFEDLDTPYRDHIALATAVCNRQIELMHDITQDLFDAKMVAERDHTMMILANTIGKLVLDDTSGFDSASDKDKAIIYACALSMNKANILDSNFLESIHDASQIEEIVAVTTVIIKLM